MVLKPLVKWSGGKTDELEKIIAHMPDTYDTYVEPFVGGGALFFHLEPEKSIINDIHPELISLYRQVQEGNGQRIYDTMKKHKNDEATYYEEEEYDPPVIHMLQLGDTMKTISQKYNCTVRAHLMDRQKSL